MPQHYHELSTTQVLRSLGSGRDTGLFEQEIKARQKKYGANELPKTKPAGWLIILLRQFASPFMYILLFAAVVSVFFHDYVDAGVIVAAIVVNTLVGFIQEYKASKALDHLRSLVKPIVRVRRDGSEVSIPAHAVVPGDILILQAGDHVAADARIIESISLETNEATLTGESMPIAKGTDSLAKGTVLAERSNMIFAGTVVTVGKGQAVVVDIGLKTELGKIAKLITETKEEKTPLQVQLVKLAKLLTIIFVSISVLIFFVGVFSGRSVFEMFLTSVALAVAAVPEGLLVAVTVIFAIGMQRILRRQALVRKLVATETLGSVSVICTDKTGTITMAQMEATDIVAEDKDLAQTIAILCNDAVVSEKDIVLGSPTEAALMRSALSSGLDAKELNNKHKRLFEIPFDSKHKYMVTLNEWEGGQAVLVKGAPEKVLEFCGDGKAARAKAEEMTKQGLRVLAVAYKKINKEKKKEINKTDLHDLTFVGLFGLRDPIRPDAKETIARAAQAGVRTVMITGDHPDTAVAIAKEAGILCERNNVLTGVELDELSDEELQKKVDEISVYARVEPMHKVRIVQAWRARGEVVSMTGDGINDAPALKAADIGVALGNGT
ncbi:MAG: HAD-IC family P-type ATPase, partial [Candidatus Uhrbacteria bacterium]